MMGSIRTFEAIENSPDDRFVFYECVPTLQQIACHEVALKLWRHYIANDKSKKVREKTDDPLRIVYGLDEDYRDESDKLAKFLNAPRYVEDMVKKSLDKIRIEMGNWIRYFKEKMFKRRLIKYCVRDFNPNNCVWFQNGEIDYKKTALKMLSEAELTNEQKFVIMCLHGMEDEIKRFPLSTLSEFFKHSSLFAIEISYWHSFGGIDMTVLQRKIAALMGREDDRLIDRVMASVSAEKYFPFAFEYFWNRLDEANQIYVARSFLNKTWQLQKTILSKMSLYQQRELMSKVPAILMKNFFIKLDMPEYAFKVWSRTKNLITEVEFEALINLIYSFKLSSENSIRVLIDIWNSASDQLRNFVAQSKDSVILRVFLCNKQHAPSDWRFLCRFLSLTSAPTRKQLIFNDVDVFIKCNDNLNYITDILDICLPKDSEKKEFKNLVMKSSIMRENCVKLINALKFDTLKQKLALYSSSDRLTQELMKELLNTNFVEVKIFILDYEKWNRLSNFLLEIFANDSSTVSELKKHLISSFSSDAVFYWNKSVHFSEMVKVVDHEFSHGELEAYKRTVLKNFQECIITKLKQFWRYFNGNCFNTLVLWCLGNEKKVLEFKIIVPVDAIFDDVFGTIRGWCAINGTDYEPYHLLNKLDEFLRCFCVDYEEAKKFKIRKFNDLNEYLFHNSWLNSGERTWYEVLMWLFENDEDEALKFQSNDSKDTRKRRKLDVTGRFR